MAIDASVPRTLVEVARTQAGYVTSRQCDEHGVHPRRRRRLVESGLWLRPARGVYDTGHLSRPLQHAHPYDRARSRAVELGFVVHPRGAALGAAALAVHGVRGLPRSFTVELALPSGQPRRRRAGIRVRQSAVQDDVVRVGGRFTVSVAVALVQAAGSLDRHTWVACADDALRRELVTMKQLADALHAARGRRGIRDRRCWLDMTNTGSESPLESRARLQLADAGIAPDELQHEMWSDAGVLLGRVDMAWYLGDGRWLLVEIDGNEYHSTSEQLDADTLRQNGLLAAGGNILLRFRAAHLYEPGRFVGSVDAVLRRENWRPGRPLPTP